MLGETTAEAPFVKNITAALFSLDVMRGFKVSALPGKMVDTGLVCTIIHSPQQTRFVFTANLLMLPNMSHKI